MAQKNEALATEKYQFLINCKLNRQGEIREAGIIIQSQLFWFGVSLMRLFLTKTFKKLTF